MNPIDKLRSLLDKAKIPYENFIEPVEDYILEDGISRYGQAGKWRWNQVIYGRYRDDKWKLDAIWHYGSHGCTKGMLETYGKLGVDKHHEPMVLSPEEVFNIIRSDWEKNK